MNTTSKGNSSAEKIYFKYEHLAYKYANKIHSYEQLSFEYEDLVQEFKIKIYTSIIAYAKKWKKHVEFGYIRPVPIQFYLESACLNKVKDFMKYITNEGYKVRIDDTDFDYGTISDSRVDSGKNEFILNGVDVLENLTGKYRAAFSMYLRGYTKNQIDKVIRDNDRDDDFTTEDIIELQKDFLIKKYGESTLKNTSQVIYSYNVANEE